MPSHLIGHADLIELAHHAFSTVEHLLCRGGLSCLGTEFGRLLLQCRRLLLRIGALSATPRFIGSTRIDRVTIPLTATCLILALIPALYANPDLRFLNCLILGGTLTLDVDPVAGGLDDGVLLRMQASADLMALTGRDAEALTQASGPPATGSTSRVHPSISPRSPARSARR